MSYIYLGVEFKERRILQHISQELFVCLINNNQMRCSKFGYSKYFSKIIL